jgi:hypothetical protein
LRVGGRGSVAAVAAAWLLGLALSLVVRPADAQIIGPPRAPAWPIGLDRDSSDQAWRHAPPVLPLSPTPETGVERALALWEWLKGHLLGLVSRPGGVLLLALGVRLLSKRTRGETLSGLLFVVFVVLAVSGGLWLFDKWVHWAHRAQLLAAVIVVVGTPTLVALRHSRHRAFAAAVTAAGSVVTVYGIIKIGQETAAVTEIVAGMLHMVEGLSVLTETRHVAVAGAPAAAAPSSAGREARPGASDSPKKTDHPR